MTTIIQFEVWLWTGYPYELGNYREELDIVRLWLDKQSFNIQDKFEELKFYIFSL
jgi:hypothetical protein